MKSFDLRVLVHVAAWIAVMSITPEPSGGQEVSVHDEAAIATTHDNGLTAVSKIGKAYPYGASLYLGPVFQLETSRFRLTKAERSRSDRIAIHFAVGGLLGAVVGYAVYQRTGKQKPCDDKSGQICGPLPYIAVGGVVGLGVGALVGYLRTRPKN